MPVQISFDLTKGTDTLLVIDMAPPADVGGWSARFTVTKRMNASASGILVERLCASGFGGGQSGITVLNSGQGSFGIVPPTPEETSGWSAGVYACQFERTDSGSRTVPTQGRLLFGANIRG